MAEAGFEIAGLVVGTRKAATTWIYANLLADERFCVSGKVKESGFFGGSSGLEFDEYRELYAPRAGQYCVEVDSSICYSPEAARTIARFASGAGLVLVLRNPVDYLVSRYVHSTRKGELASRSIAAALDEASWLGRELDYEGMVARLTGLPRNPLLVLPYESLAADNLGFMRRIVEHLTGGEESLAALAVAERQNVARNSAFPLLSRALASAAKRARALRLHGLVNLAKKTGVLRLIEREARGRDLLDLRKQAEAIVERDFGKSIEIWERLARS